MADAADGRYGYRAWDRRPGDDVDPSVMLNPAETIVTIEMQTPVPLPAGYTPRLLGVERDQPTIMDVLNAGPVTLMRDTPTRQDSGMQGTMRPAGTDW